MTDTTQQPDHAERAHSIYSASGSPQWLNCPGSIKAQENMPDDASPFAAEGTLAHELADICLTGKADANFYIGEEIDGDEITPDMAGYVQQYLDYVRSYETKFSILMCEDKVDYTHLAPDGFGTFDAAIIDESGDVKTLHMFDLKYGRGVVVEAYHNTQAQLYALGLIHELEPIGLGDFDEVVMHIVQPRVNNFPIWKTNMAELSAFAEDVKSCVAATLVDDPERIAGDKQCQWCKAKSTCRTLLEHTQQVIGADFDDLSDEIQHDNLNDSELRHVLENTKIVEMFLKAVHGDVFKRLESGEDFEGFKLVHGRSNRKWNDDAEKKLVRKVGAKQAYNKKLIGVGDATKLTDKKFIDKLTFKPEGSLTLVPESDKRDAVSMKPVSDDFDNFLEDD
tara:strand:- start:1017 stop:2198 length:1182 start_codon:yes stop_codon:yes gene_type:complete